MVYADNSGGSTIVIAASRTAKQARPVICRFRSRADGHTLAAGFARRGGGEEDRSLTFPSWDGSLAVVSGGVLFASPVRKPAPFLEWFLRGLERLDVGGRIDWFFVDDNDDANSSALLASAENLRGEKTVVRPDGERPDFRTGATREWRQETVDRVASFREAILDAARAGDYEGLLLVDADLVLRPDTLRCLLATERDIVSEVFWTRWRPDDDELPNVWLTDHYNLFKYTRGEGMLSQREAAMRQSRFLGMLRTPGVYRVGGLGACTFFSRRALAYPISYMPLYNLTWMGEDRHFCLRAAALGLELWADTHCPPLHLYRESDLGAVQRWSSAVFGSSGSSGQPSRNRRRERR